MKKCKHCQKVFCMDDNFCPDCGKALTSEKTHIYANIGKKGVTSISYRLPDGITINTKGNMTISFGKGISYTTKSKNS